MLFFTDDGRSRVRNAFATLYKAIQFLINFDYQWHSQTVQLVKRSRIRLWSGRFEIQILKKSNRTPVLPTARH